MYKFDARNFQPYCFRRSTFKEDFLKESGLSSHSPANKISLITITIITLITIIIYSPANNYSTTRVGDSKFHNFKLFAYPIFPSSPQRKKKGGGVGRGEKMPLKRFKTVIKFK